MAQSGGQKQRDLIARALYRQPPILLLDEATSYLDSSREQAVNAAIHGTLASRIFVAHRPDTLSSTSRVIVIEDGKIVKDEHVCASPPLSVVRGFADRRDGRAGPGSKGRSP